MYSNILKVYLKIKSCHEILANRILRPYQYYVMGDNKEHCRHAPLVCLPERHHAW